MGNGATIKCQRSRPSSTLPISGVGYCYKFPVMDGNATLLRYSQSMASEIRQLYSAGQQEVCGHSVGSGHFFGVIHDDYVEWCLPVHQTQS